MIEHPSSGTRSRKSVTDSPWFWLYVFCSAGLIALFLMGPKYGPRQAQIERKYQGREQAMTPADDRPQDVHLSSSDDTVITLTPLYLLLGTVFVISWFMLWKTHFRVARQQKSSPLPSNSSTSNSSQSRSSHSASQT